VAVWPLASDMVRSGRALSWCTLYVERGPGAGDTIPLALALEENGLNIRGLERWVYPTSEWCGSYACSVWVVGRPGGVRELVMIRLVVVSRYLCGASF